jgi:hypothetical protein
VYVLYSIYLYISGCVKGKDVEVQVLSDFTISKTSSAVKVVTFSQLISDAGFQGEITSISTAAQQIEVFSRVLKTTISSFLQNSEDWQNSILECAVSDSKPIVCLRTLY